MRLPDEATYDEKLDDFFRNIDESFTLGSDSDATCDWLTDEFVEYWMNSLAAEHVPTEKDIAKLAQELQDELYGKEASYECTFEEGDR